MSGSDSKTTTSGLIHRRWTRGLLILGTMLTLLVIVGFTWLWMGVRSNHGAITVTAEQIEKTKWMRYETGGPATFETITEEVQAALDVLQPDLENLSQDVEHTLAKLREDDPHLDAALNDYTTTPLVGADGGRSTLSHFAKRATALRGLLADFETHYKGPAEAKLALRQPLFDLVLANWQGDGDTVQPSAFVRNVYESGERDPLVCYSLLLHQPSGSDERVRLCTEAIQSLDKRPCCALLRAMVTTKIGELKGMIKGSEYVSIHVRAKDDLFAAIKEHVEDDAAIDLLRPKLSDLVGAMNACARGDLLIEAIGLPDNEFPRWLKHYLVYRIASDIGRYYRGNDYISAVSRDNLAMFERFSTIAGKHLVKAWCLKPDVHAFPQLLLHTENWAGVTPLSVHEWFRIGVSQNVDDEQLYANYSTALLPRWGGSHDALLNMATLCAKYPHSEMPVTLFSAYFSHQAIEEVSRQMPYTFDVRLLYQALRTVDYLKTVDLGTSQRYFGDGRAALTARTLWDWGRLNELAWLVENFPECFDEADWPRRYFFDVKLVRAISMAAAHGNTLGWTQLQQELFLHSHSLTAPRVESLRLLFDEMRAASSDKQAEAWLVCDQLLAWLAAYHAGEEVELRIDKLARGWTIFEMGIEPDNGGFVATVDAASHYGYMRPMVAFPPPHTFEADVEMLNDVPDTFGMALLAGPVEEPFDDNKERGAVLRYIPGHQYACLHPIPGSLLSVNENEIYSFRVDQSGKKRIRLTVGSNDIEGSLGNEGAEGFAIVGNIETKGIVGLGRYTETYNDTYKNQNAIYRVTNIRVRKLESQAIAFRNTQAAR